MQRRERYRPQHPIRVVTAASLFDGHDAAIHIMRRILQASGAEVIHLGHNRSVEEVAVAAVQEDASAVAVSSYQGGHVEYFRYLRERLNALGGADVRIFGGGGGVIIPDEIRMLEAEGSVDRIYSPEDGRRLGLEGMIDDLLARADRDPLATTAPTPADLDAGSDVALARWITRAEAAADGTKALPHADAVRSAAASREVPVIGLTGTGGAGKSSLTDELLRRWLFDHDTGRVAVLSVDPTRKRSGGALLGDRIRMNALHPERVFMRSLATRERKGELSAALGDAIAGCKAAGFDVVFVETSGIGQGDADITDLADVSVYVMTPEYGAPSQLEKIDMLDFADLIAINKFSRRGALDAYRDVVKQVRRNRSAWDVADEVLPVYGTEAARFHDPGVTALYHGLLDRLAATAGGRFASFNSRIARPTRNTTDADQAILPPTRERYLADIAATVRRYHVHHDAQAEVARRCQRLRETLAEVQGTAAADAVHALLTEAEAGLDRDVATGLDRWQDLIETYSADALVYTVRGQEIRQPLTRESLAGTRVRRVAVPRHLRCHGAIARFLSRENLPGRFPYTAGVFPLKREGEDPKRMFAGEGGPARTNARFHLLCQGETAHRLSTAFDSVTLYGEDPAHRPDIFGKVGESGVSVPHLDAMKQLYAGFDLCAPTTSVSMTINGPAPILLAMFMNTAIDDHIARHEAIHGPADAVMRERLATEAVQTARGTVQADILKEDQAQNTCIFSVPFALRMMGDIQAWFVENKVRNFYSVSISGYHIAEAGANPITQLALTLSNGFTLVEAYLARGMHIDDFAPNLSFFFSNGLDPEYTVLGRVARRIWAVTLRDRYGAAPRSQMLKYHIQTSGRSLHAREIQFNDIRTTLQALLALSDNCNSLHTNAYDEAITTPTEESVRRAMAIQMIINRELGSQFNENNLQGSYFIDALTDQVEEAVLAEFEAIDRRGGVLGAMELQYQRSKIQDESMKYEHKKHDGSLPIIGINTFLDPKTNHDAWEPETPELRRATPAEKQAQIDAVAAFQAAHADAAPEALRRLQSVAMAGGNLFGELMHTVRVATLGQITGALYAVGGAYRRNL
jgi:methylmalonyl-CoA mutase